MTATTTAAAPTASASAATDDDVQEPCLRPYWQQKYRRETCKNWDNFYKRNGTNFFKDRHWLDRDFAPYLNLPAESAPSIDGGGEDDRRGVGVSVASQTEPLSDALRDTTLTDPSDARAAQVGGDVVTTTGLEIGCGVGNLAFPLLALHSRLKLYVCDFSPTAIRLVQQHADYARLHAEGRIEAFVADLTRCAAASPAEAAGAQVSASAAAAASTMAVASTPIAIDTGTGTGTNTSTSTGAGEVVGTNPLDRIAEGALDFITSIFCLGAIDPPFHAGVFSAIAVKLRSGGHLLFRDYAAGDMAELRFAGVDTGPGANSGSGTAAGSGTGSGTGTTGTGSNGSTSGGSTGGAGKSGAGSSGASEAPRIGRRLYVRGDGTMSYFFTLDDVRLLAESAGLQVVKLELVRRRLENRKTGLSGERVFVQAVLRKP